MNKQDKLDKLDKLTYVSQAEEVINSLKNPKTGRIALTTNKIRSLLSLVNELYGMARSDISPQLNEAVKSHIQYVKMHLVYEAGRENTVKDFLEKSGLLDYLDCIGSDREALMLVCRYTEALVAYHKFYSPEK